MANPANIPAVKSVTDLRAIPKLAGAVYKNVFLSSYNGTSAAGSGELFWSATSTAADDGGTVFKPSDGTTAGRWLRTPMADGSVPDGWFGVQADGVTDDTDAIQSAINIFCKYGQPIKSGVLTHSGNSVISKTLYVSGQPGEAFMFKGTGPRSANPDQPKLTWNGSSGSNYTSMIIFYGCSNSGIDGINFQTPINSNGLLQPILVIANQPTTSATLASSVTAGSNQTVTLGGSYTSLLITSGTYLGVGIGTPNFEIVTVSNIAGAVITANFHNNHSVGEIVSNQTGSSGCVFTNFSVNVPVGIRTTLSAPVTAGNNVVFTPTSMTGITPGMPIAIGGVTPTIFEETVYVKTVGATTFVVDCLFNHGAGELMITATSGICFGNPHAAGGSDQVSETVINLVSSNGGADGRIRAYAGVRYANVANNVKNHTVTNLDSTACAHVISAEDSSGSIQIIHPIGSSEEGSDFNLNGSGIFNLFSAEMESGAFSPNGSRFLTSRGAQVNVTGCAVESTFPTDDYGIVSSSQVILTNNNFQNLRTGSTLPLVNAVGLYSASATNQGGAVVSIGNCYINATPTSNIFFWSGNAVNYSSVTSNAGRMKLFSLYDYGTAGNILPVFGFIASMDASMTTDGLSAGLTFNRLGELRRTVQNVTIPFASLQVAALTNTLTIAGIPSNARIVGAMSDVTATFGGTAGTLTFRLGTSSGGQELLLDFDGTATGFKGNADADLGTGLARATAVQGGVTLTSLAAGSAFLKLTSSSGNLSGLTTGSITISLVLERLF